MMLMKLLRRSNGRRDDVVDRRQVRRGGRRHTDFKCAVTCAFCGSSEGRAFNVTSCWFYWTCTRCARTELIVLPSDGPETAPASVVLWRMRDQKRADVVASIMLCPGRGFELQVTHGRQPARAELFDDPNVLLERSRDVRERFLEQGFVELEPIADS